MPFVLGYSLTGSLLTITTVGGAPDSVLGQWEKIDTPDSDETNPDSSGDMVARKEK
jgi:hypothetical protein